jgi:hypothetical protein
LRRRCESLLKELDVERGDAEKLRIAKEKEIKGVSY